jgi:hypothetical protein
VPACAGGQTPYNARDVPRWIAITLGVLTLAPPALARDRWMQALDRGEILVSTRDVGGVEEAVAKAVINAAPERVWPLIDRCGDWHRVMPRIKASQELSRRGGKVVCRLTADMPFPYSDPTSVTEAIHAVKGGVWSRRWTLREGDYQVNAGSWVLRRFEGARDRTLVVYRARVEPKAWVPDWVRRWAQRKTVPKMIEGLRQQVR